MEVGDAVALKVPVKRERSPSSERTPDVPPVKRHADETTGVARAPVKFSWRECQNLDDVKRLKIKEKAVKQGKENCNKIRALLEPAIAAVDVNPDSTDAIIIGRKIIQQWLDQDNATHEALKKHHVLVGVEGPTGAGKSSFLGSLLRIPELLPSGQESAATAVIGKVSWNSNDTPGHEFRAEITFRPKEDVQNDLESLLKELNRYKDLMANKFREEDDDAQDKADAIIESRNKIEYELPKIKAVWGIEKEHLEKAVTNCPEWRTYTDVALGILKKNNHALKLLDKGCVECHQNTAKELGKIIKPYLDSSCMKVGDRVEFALWPLVKEVHIFAKAEILKFGITLVDLPGCGDATASRSEVAQKISSDLDVRMIVSPIIRATDEKQGQTLMQGGFDEAQMRIRGKLDGNGFGVIISKIDGINFESYIDGCDELWGDEEIAKKRERLAGLKDELAELSRKSTNLRNNKTRAENAKKSAQKRRRTMEDKQERKPSANPGQDAERLATAQAAVDRTVQAYDEADKTLDEHHEESRRVEQEQTYLRDWLNHRASQTRNTRVIKRMRENFAIRQREFGDESMTQKSQVEEDYILPIYPISTTAFWQLEKGDRRLDGFPSQRFTGIPAVEQWLHRATLAKREKHLDEILDGYQSQLGMMRIYSQTSGGGGNFNFTRGEVEQAVARTHSFFVEKLGLTLKGAAMEIENLDPLEHRDKAVAKFVREAKKIALRWVYKFPDDHQSTLKISPQTYYANIRRSGGKFQSHSTPRVTYNWMENLAAPVLKIIGKDWDSKMNKQLPEVRIPMMGAFSTIWTKYLNELQKDISEKVPTLEDSFKNMRPILDQSQRATETKIRATLGRLAQKSSDITFDAVEYLSEGMEPAFEAARQIMGKGSHKTRQGIIMAKVNKDVKPMCNEVLDRLAKGLATRKAEVPKELDLIAEEAICGVKQQMSFLVNNLVENFPVKSEDGSTKTELQNSIRRFVENWEDEWAQEGNYEEHILDKDLSIPDTILKPVYEELLGEEPADEEDCILDDDDLDMEM